MCFSERGRPINSFLCKWKSWDFLLCTCSKGQPYTTVLTCDRSQIIWVEKKGETRRHSFYSAMVLQSCPVLEGSPKMISLVTKQSSCSGTARSFIFLPLGSLSCSSGLCSLSYMYSEWQIRLLRGFKLKFKVNSNVFAPTLLISFGLKQMPAERCVLLIFAGPHTRKIIEGLLHCWHEMPPLSVSFRATS